MKIQLKNVEQFLEMLIRKGHTRRSLAGVANVGEATVVMIANGDRNPSPQTAKRICEALEVEFDDIFVIEKREQVAR